MASVLSLKQQQLPQHAELKQLIHDMKGFCNGTESGCLVDLLKQFDFELLKWVLVQCGLNHWFKFPNWSRLAEATKRLGQPCMLDAIQCAADRQNFSLETVIGIAEGRIPRTHHEEKQKKREVSIQERQQRQREQAMRTGERTDVTIAPETAQLIQETLKSMEVKIDGRVTRTPQEPRREQTASSVNDLPPLDPETEAALRRANEEARRRVLGHK